ncbi:MAG: bifunctional demethylmenaquinone methyltransferase/2-methoxy-6-polyprenyl-1,4-benzoquinol methylase UbiE [Planctomycetia bacterium]|nr:bifunctional demethylmenaquinone methyltransferase/2-methoxy-6-polyprenyl-1,4-benzoquinol methylase UbiE [Planctomycetia bacterium]
MVDRSSHRVQKMFGEIAGRYDFLNHFLSMGIDHWWRWGVVRNVAPRNIPGAKILDVCTGTGDLAIAFWKKYHIPVVGVDFCVEMLEIGREKIRKLNANAESGAETLELREGDACALPFDDETFEVVSVAFGLRNVEDMRRGLQELIRVCVPGGKVAILEFSTPTFPPIRWAYSFYFHKILPRIGQLVAKNRFSAYEYLPQSVDEFPQGEKLTQIMREMGLESVAYRPLTFGIATLYTGTKSATQDSSVPD